MVLTLLAFPVSITCVNYEVRVSSKKRNPLEDFKLFYEEITNTKPLRNRVRRVRAAASTNG